MRVCVYHSHMSPTPAGPAPRQGLSASTDAPARDASASAAAGCARHQTKRGRPPSPHFFGIVQAQFLISATEGKHSRMLNLTRRKVLPEHLHALKEATIRFLKAWRPPGDPLIEE